MEKFAETLTGNEVAEFNRKQKMLQNSLRGTRGETAALEQSSKNYQREIERLIKRGLSPNSDAVRQLRAEQEQLQRRIDDARKAQERKTKALQTAKTALKATAVAVAGVVTGAIALTKRNANLANGFLNSARTVGMTTETFQELDYAMRMSGIENGEYMLNRLNRSIIDVRNETGTLTKFLEDNYHELLTQLQGVENNEEAFTLLMDAIHRAPNEFAAAELAMAAFGRNGAQMVLAAQNGAEGINALREEARQLGVVSDENAQAAARFNDAMYRLRTAAQNLTQELTVKLLPILTNVVVRLTNAIQRLGEFRARMQGVITTVRELTPQIAGVTAGVGAFIGVMKGTKYVTAFAAALKYTKTVVIGLKNYKKLLTTVSAILAGVKTLGIGTLIKVAAACVAAAAAYASLSYALGVMRERLSSVNAEVEDLGDLNTFEFMAEEVADLDVALTQLAWGGAAAVAESMEEVADKTEEARNKLDKYLRERLALVEYTANQEKNNQINIIQQFLMQRARLEADNWEERKAFLKEQKEFLLEHEYVLADERYALEEALQRAIRDLYKETAEKAENYLKQKLSALSVFFGGFSQLLKAAGRDNVAFANAGRAVAIVQAGINTALAITKTLSQFGATPVGIAKAVGIGMKGAAQKARIIGSMIPSAETGGRFVVPQSRGVDGSIMRVNPGETVDITPRGMAGTGGVSQYIFRIGEQTIFDIVNRGGRAGDIHVFEPAANF